MNPSSSTHPFLLRPPQNPNSFFQPPPLTTTASANPVLDLSATLSSLTHLLSVSHQTLDSLSSTLPTNSNNVHCPYNPHHLMPPESLFLHSLRCPSSLFEDPASLIRSLHYPKTLNPEVERDPLCESTEGPELSLSLDRHYSEFFCSNFFYKDCPAVVSFSSLDFLSRKCTLPAVLSVECADFVASNDGQVKGFDKNGCGVLPSELWSSRREIEGWVDYPVAYSYSVACVISKVNLVKENDLREWIIASSPRYGVLIDVCMRDHISVLFSLCLKAISREALDTVGCLMSTKSSSAKCPVLSQVLMWIASQFSALYGEVNAKCFAIQIVKQCVSWAANQLLFTPTLSCLKSCYAKDSNIEDTKNKGLCDESVGHKGGTLVDGSIDGVVIFVSQVAAAVAALHERSLLEEKIRELRGSQLQSRYQRMAEHEHLSKRAEDERKRNPNYRAIIDHDGLFRKRLTDQETSKDKTKEELLAEERDYKRRRMSYRGKKVKRTTVQVMRDIINDYMEEIEQAGGIDCFEKGTEKEGTSPKLPVVPGATLDVNYARKNNYEYFIASRSASGHDMKQTESSHSIRSSSLKASAGYDFEQHEGGPHEIHNHLEYSRSTSQDRRQREFSSSLERQRTHGRLHERRSHQRDQYEAELSRTKHHGRSSTKSNCHK